ncbi:MAG: tetratricopeptide repeat protein [Magnetococcales bacterium]|nr:tetratricopeptide repeat protein [Magnetococcales bacterium]
MDPKDMHKALAHLRQGAAAEALAEFRKLLQLHPHPAELLYHAGVAAHQAGEAREALHYLEKAAHKAPEVAEIQFSLATVLFDLGRETDAEEAYRRAIHGNPKLERAHFRLGELTLQRGNAIEAIRHFKASLQLAPGRVETLFGLGTALVAEGRFTGALPVVREGIALGDGRFLNLLAQLLPWIDPPREENAALQKEVLILLERRLTDAQLLMPVVLELLRQDRQLAALLALGDVTSVLEDNSLETWWREALRGEREEAALEHPLLRAILPRGLLAAGDWERALTNLRALWLAEMRHRDDDWRCPPALQPLLLALALHCFHGGYAWFETEQERQWIGEEQDRLVRNGPAYPAERWVMLACYRVFHRIPGLVDALPDHPVPLLKELLRHTVMEPLEEEQEMPHIPLATSQMPGLTCAVRERYDDLAHPRWLPRFPLLPSAMPGLEAWLAQCCPRVPLADWRPVNPLQVLVAGCGSGEETIRLAARLPSARLLAVDDNCSALAYARRAARLLGVENVRFAQADLSRLGEWQENFHLIVGGEKLLSGTDASVLWRSLVELLAPGGILRLTMESERGLKERHRLREWIAKHGDLPTAAGLRQLRRTLLDQPGLWPGLRHSPEFYSLPGCRELLFSESGRGFRLPTIAAMSIELGLTVLGLELEDPRLMPRYRGRFLEDETGTDLLLWDRFEEETPLGSHYRIWFQEGN